MPRLADAAAVAVGAAAGLGADAAVARVAPNWRTVSAATGLVAAAAIYPLARRRVTADAALARELGGVLATSAVAVLARKLPPLPARMLLGAAWTAHALFDDVHTTSGDSRLPDWYPAMCAGYDIALGARLIARP